MKQHQHGDAGSPPEEEQRPSSSSSSYARPRKRRSFKSVVLDVMNFHRIHEYVVPVLEPLVRRVVKEEFESAMEKHMAIMKWDSGNEMDMSMPRRLQLQFSSSLSLPVFTGTRIEGGDCNTLKVDLIDAHTGKTVSSGIESSAKVEIVVLEGDFNGDDGDNWTLEEFNANIVKEREGKKHLLNGNAFLNLKEGIGLVGDLFFTDNSSWTRSRKFRLGARVLDSCDGIRVREAVSESFVVRDHRGELYKKHHPPYLSDEVWRLEKIGKDGAFHQRLNREKVKTVKDFLVLLYLDPVRLRNILGSGMSSKMWEVTMEHARRCVIDNTKLYLYCPGFQKRDGVVFNVVGQLLGLLSDCKYVVLNELSESEKEEAHKLVISAFLHLDEIVSYDDESSLRNSTCSISEDLYPSDPQTETLNHEGSQTKSSRKKGRFDYPEMSTSSPDAATPSTYSIGGVESFSEYCLNDINSIDVGFDQPLFSDTLICDTDKDLQYFDTPSQAADLRIAVDGFLFPRSAQRRWKIVSLVLKCLSLMLEIRDTRNRCPR